MKYQSLIMRVLCLILIIGAVLAYNSMQKKESDTRKDQEIASLSVKVEKLEEQQKEILSAIQEAAKAQEEAAKQAEEKSKTSEKDEKNASDADTKESEDAEDEEELAYKNGTYTGEGQGFEGTIQVQVTLEDDTITDIQVVSAPGEDSAYLSQGKGVISSILSAQSTDVDTISGATFSSTGIINAVNDALGKAENP